MSPVETATEPPSIDVDRIYDLLSARSNQYAAQPLIEIPGEAATDYADDGVRYTYAETATAVSDLCERYTRAGVGTGTRVAAMLDNRAECLLHLLALNGVGASLVPISSSLRDDEVRYLVEHSEAALMLASPERAAHAARALEGLQSPPPLCTDLQLISLERVVAESADGSVTGRHAEAALLYTSGTTGQPKGCILTNEYFLMLGDWYRDLGGIGALRPGVERLITPLPLNHMNALACSFMGMLNTGGCLIQLDRFHPRTWWRSVRASRATVLHYLGVMPAMLLKAPPTPEDDFGNQIRFGFGAGVDPRHQADFEARFGFPLIEAWAMTETGAGACIAANEEPRHVGTRCFGRAPDDLEWRLVDEAGADVTAGEPGELLVRQAGEQPRRGFFARYLKNDAATAEAWADGWFHTGDVVRVAADGSFHFVDRRKNVIRRSGENIAAVEVEGVLLQHPRVRNCVVAPVADELREQEVMTCIVIDGDVDNPLDIATELARFCRDRLAYFKVPAHYAFVDDLPTTASQKIRRGEVRDICDALLAAGDTVDLSHLKRGSAQRP